MLGMLSMVHGISVEIVVSAIVNADTLLIVTVIIIIIIISRPSSSSSSSSSSSRLSDSILLVIPATCSSDNVFPSPGTNLSDLRDKIRSTSTSRQYIDVRLLWDGGQAEVCRGSRRIFIATCRHRSNVVRLWSVIWATMSRLLGASSRHCQRATRVVTACELRVNSDNKTSALSRTATKYNAIFGK